MKTAEEIFNEHSWSALGAISPSKNFCLPAMDEFAAQEVAKEVEAYKRRLIAEIEKRITNDNHDSCAQAFDHGLNTVLTIIDTTK